MRIRTLALMVLPLLYACGGRENDPPTSQESELPAPASANSSSAPPQLPKPKEPPVFEGEFDFKGITLGMSEKDVSKLFPGFYGGFFNYSKKTSKSFKIRGCRTMYAGYGGNCRVSIANGKVKEANLQFLNDRLGLLIIGFEPKNFETVADGLTQKFGTPYRLSSNTLKNELTGVESTFVVMEWRNRNGYSMMLASHRQEGSNYLHEGQLEISDQKFIDQLLADQAKLGAKPAKQDL